MEIKKELVYKVDYINPTEKTNPSCAYVPAFRGQDQLIIYTYDYCYKTKNGMSGTNPWGLEIAINEDGIATEISDRLVIPQKGFLLSGNSKAHTFLLENVELGTKVSFDEKSMLLTVHVNKIKSALYTLNIKIQEIQNRVKEAFKDVLLFDRHVVQENVKWIETNFLKLNQMQANDLDEKTINEFFEINDKIQKKITEVYCATMPSYSVESRGVWFRPEEKTLQEIIHNLDIMQECNLNTLYVESFYNGNIPGISKITDTCEEVKEGDYGIYKKDYLKALIAEAHKRNIEVHAWVENFFVGEHIRFDKDYPDEFRMVNYDGTTMQGPGDGNSEIMENGFIFLDPANPKVHEYVLSIYEEMLTNYDFDGFHIDYVRYPNGNLDILTSNGYSEYAMEEFKKRYGYAETENVRELVKDDKVNQQWIQYRCDKITLMVKEVYELVHKIKPNCKISMAVVPETDYAIKNKMQDWVKWVKNGWIDITLPMAYYFGTSEIENATRNLVTFNENKAFSYTGISPNYPGAPSVVNAYQIEACIKNKAQGYAIFALHNILPYPSIQHVLKIGPNRNAAVLPHGDFNKILNAYKSDLLEKIIYFEENNELVHKKEFLHKINALKADNLEDLINKLNYFIEEVKKDLVGNSYQAFIKQTQHILTILKIQEYQATK